MAPHTPGVSERCSSALAGLNWIDDEKRLQLALLLVLAPICPHLFPGRLGGDILKNGRGMCGTGQRAWKRHKTDLLMRTPGADSSELGSQCQAPRLLAAGSGLCPDGGSRDQLRPASLPWPNVAWIQLIRFPAQRKPGAAVSGKAQETKHFLVWHRCPQPLGGACELEGQVVLMTPLHGQAWYLL